MSLRFRGKDLRPVLNEAIANKCKIILVKDQGVYFLAERGERRADGCQKLIAMQSAAPRISMRSMIGGSWQIMN